MYNDPNYNQTNQSEENRGFSYSSNGYNYNQHNYNYNNSYENPKENNGYDSNNTYSDSSYSNNYDNNSYDPNSYNTNNYDSNSYDSNSYNTNNYDSNSYDSNSNNYDSNSYNSTNSYDSNSSDYSNSYASNDYNANSYDANSYNSSQYDYNADQHTNGYGQESPQYMDLLDKAEQLSAENKDLRSSKRALRVTLTIVFLLLAVAIGYIVFSEVKAPLFGKWPKIAQQNQQLVAQMDTLNMMKQELDSLQKANNILVENVTPPEQRGVFFEVQIGAFQTFDLQKYMGDLARLRGENVEGMNKYTIGRFREYKRAEAFKTDIQRMGVSDAFIVATIDGQKVDTDVAIKASRKSR